jgi:hypothetical protein
LPKKIVRGSQAQFFIVIADSVDLVATLCDLDEGTAFTVAEMIIPMMMAPTSAISCFTREEIRVFDI